MQILDANCWVNKLTISGIFRNSFDMYTSYHFDIAKFRSFDWLVINQNEHRNVLKNEFRNSLLPIFWTWCTCFVTWNRWIRMHWLIRSNGKQWNRLGHSNDMALGFHEGYFYASLRIRNSMARYWQERYERKHTWNCIPF